MKQTRIIELHKGIECIKIEFCYCSPGQYRIVNIPIKGAKNSIVEFTTGFWMQSCVVDLGMYEFIYGLPYYEHGFEKSELNCIPWSGMSFNEVEHFLAEINNLVVLNEYTFSFDLPCRTEWEHALLCGQDAFWSWGNDENELGDYAWYVENSNNKIHKSRGKKSNQWGLYDMYGNVYEYCYDVEFDSLSNVYRDTKPAQYSKQSVFPVLGGAYNSALTECSEYRYIGYFNDYIEPTGFRLIIRNGNTL